MGCWLLRILLGVLVLLDAGASLGLGDEKDEGPLKIRYDTGVWSIIVFLALFLILKKYAWGPILEGLQKREASIRDALADAQGARVEANQIRAELQVQLDRAGEKVAEIMESARRDAVRLHEEMTAKTRTEIQAERDRLRREIDLAKDQALHELWTQTAHLATLISAKAIGRQMNEADHRHLVDEALAELGRAGTDWQKQGAGVRL